MSNQRGFTLIELVVAMALLGTMMVLMYSGLTFSLKGWDTGAASGQRITDRRIGENFLRRELSELFPMRWKDPMVLRLAFEGEAQRMRFVSASRQTNSFSSACQSISALHKPCTSGWPARNCAVRCCDVRSATPATTRFMPVLASAAPFISSPFRC